MTEEKLREEAEESIPDLGIKSVMYRHQLDALRRARINGITSEAAKQYWEEKGWISVKDILPKNTNHVLTMGSHDTARIGFYSNKNKYWVVDNCGLNKGTITHWRELPTPPITEG